MLVKAILSERIEAAFARLGLEGQALVQNAARPEFGDYQANGVMGAYVTLESATTPTPLVGCHRIAEP